MHMRKKSKQKQTYVYKLCKLYINLGQKGKQFLIKTQIKELVKLFANFFIILYTLSEGKIYVWEN